MPGVIEGLLGLYNVRDAGAKGDGQTNDTPRVHDAILALPPSGGTVVFPPGTYFLGSNVTFQGRTNVTLWLLAGASFSGPGALPANAGTNRVFDMSFVSGSFPPSGPAGGTLSGTYPNPAIAAPPAPTTQAFGDAAAAGASGTAADAAHRHGMPGDQSVGSRQVALTKVSADVSATESTTSTTYTDLTTVGPSVTLSPGIAQQHLLIWSASALNSVAGNDSWASVAIAGGAASDADGQPVETAQLSGASRAVLTGVVASPSTHTMKYRANAGSATFARRRLVAVAL